MISEIKDKQAANKAAGQELQAKLDELRDQTAEAEAYQAALAEQRPHELDIRVAQQTSDSATGALGTDAIKHVVRAIPKKLALGKVAPASTADASGEYAVQYLATFINGKKVTEVDPLNFICIINGVDCLAAVRKALGKV